MSKNKINNSNVMNNKEKANKKNVKAVKAISKVNKEPKNEEVEIYEKPIAVVKESQVSSITVTVEVEDVKESDKNSEILGSDSNKLGEEENEEKPMAKKP